MEECRVRRVSKEDLLDLFEREPANLGMFFGATVLGNSLPVPNQKEQERAVGKLRVVELTERRNVIRLDPQLLPQFSNERGPGTLPGVYVTPEDVPNVWGKHPRWRALAKEDCPATQEQTAYDDPNG